MVEAAAEGEQGSFFEQQPDVVEVDPLISTVESLVGNYTTQYPDADIVCEFLGVDEEALYDIEKVDASISAPKGAIAIVLNNLVGNTIKYGGDPPQVRIEVSKEDDGCRASVIDNGEGLDDQELTQLNKALQLKSNFRLSKHARSSTLGSGIGFVTVQKILKMLDSTLEINSVVGQGSSLGFILGNN